MNRGRFITFEGVDGAGKSTHLGWAADFLRGRGLNVVATREPGGTDLGEKLRDLLLHQADEIHPEAEALLMFAARREHVERIIAPALARGQIVLCDRFSDATFAYQGGGRGVDGAKLEMLERWVHPGLQPDLTLYFDVPLEVARARLAGLKGPDRFEKEGTVFFQRVRAEYLRRAAQMPQRIQVVDATESKIDVQAKLEKILLELCLN